MNQFKKPKGLFVPSPLEIAIFLCVMVILLATLTTGRSLVENLGFWRSGMWSLLAFTTQISMILMGGFVLASSRPVQILLKSMAGIAGSASQVYLITFFLSALTCWLNWGLGLITGAFLAVEMAKRHKPINFPLLVATAYMGFLFWHGGMSGSIPLVVSTEGNFSENFVGSIVGVSQTIFSALNLLIIVSLLIGLSLLVFLLGLKKNSPHFKDWSAHFKSGESVLSEIESEESLFSRLSWFLIVGLLGSAFLIQVSSGTFSLGLNQVIYVLLFLGILFHGSLNSFIRSASGACQKLAPILVQYPLYAGIMAVMVESGLAVKMSDFFVSISSEKTYSSFIFLSAGLVNFFVPSGGGQWAVQAPVVTEGARQLGVSMPSAIMAVAWGDAWTNLAQPFWALPLLSIAGLELKEILGYCFKALIVSGVLIFLILLGF